MQVATSIDVQEHIINRSSLLRQTIEIVGIDESAPLSLSKAALASWLNCLKHWGAVSLAFHPCSTSIFTVTISRIRCQSAGAPPLQRFFSVAL